MILCRHLLQPSPPLVVPKWRNARPPLQHFCHRQLEVFESEASYDSWTPIEEPWRQQDVTLSWWCGFGTAAVVESHLPCASFLCERVRALSSADL